MIEPDPVDDAREELRQRGFLGALQLVLIVGAARAEANDAQLARLRKRMPAVTERIRESGDVGPLRQLLREVMGASWSPGEEWARQIVALGRPE